MHSNAKPNELWFALSLADRVKVVLHALDRDKLPVFGALCPGGGATPLGGWEWEGGVLGTPGTQTIKNYNFYNIKAASCEQI